MISSEDIQRLIKREPTDRPVLSIVLDMSVNSNNKRTYGVFLNQQRSRFAELDSDREGHHREPIGEAFDRIEQWIGDVYEEANKGVAIYTEVGGDWFEAIQFPASVDNRFEIADRPLVGPLVELVEAYHHHGILLVDREHLRMISAYLDTPLREHEVKTAPYPTPHDVQRGGYSAIDFQKRKAEEVRHFFKEFALEVAQFDRRYSPDDLILLGTDENVKAFESFLPKHLQGKIVHRAHAAIDDTNAAVLERLAPFFREQAAREENDAIAMLRDRVRENHFATSGFADSLEQLQEGKVDTLVLARGANRVGGQCTRCEFFLADSASGCPYCGGQPRNGVNIAEAMIRLAAEQDVAIEFADGQALADLDGAGALLKF